MIYASIAAVIVALLAWDFGRRWLADIDATVVHDLKRVHTRLDAVIDAITAQGRDINSLRADGRKTDDLVSQLRVIRDLPVDEFRAELDKHERALKNVITDARETFATKAELKTAETSLRSGQGVTATAGNVGNGRMRMPLR
jgi:hypothetical protein